MKKDTHYKFRITSEEKKRYLDLCKQKKRDASDEARKALRKIADKLAKE